MCIRDSLSGPINFWGLPAKNGMEMAVEEINAAGGIHGRKLRLVIEDTEADPAETTTLVAKLAAYDKGVRIIRPAAPGRVEGPVLTPSKEKAPNRPRVPPPEPTTTPSHSQPTQPSRQHTNHVPPAPP